MNDIRYILSASASLLLFAFAISGCNNNADASKEAALQAQVNSQKVQIDQLQAQSDLTRYMSQNAQPVYMRPVPNPTQEVPQVIPQEAKLAPDRQSSSDFKDQVARYNRYLTVAQSDEAEEDTVTQSFDNEARSNPYAFFEPVETHDSTNPNDDPAVDTFRNGIKRRMGELQSRIQPYEDDVDKQLIAAQALYPSITASSNFGDGYTLGQPALPEQKATNQDVATGLCQLRFIVPR